MTGLPPREPLLAVARRAEALAVVAEVAEALQRPWSAWDLGPADDPTGLRTGSLASGRAGAALFLAHRAAALGLDAERELAVALVNEAIDVLVESEMDASLFRGLAGVAFVVEEMSALFPEPGADDPNAEIDEVLLQHLDTAPPSAYDLIDGLVGIGVYGLARLARPTGALVVSRVLDHLEARAVTTPEGPAWPTPGDPGGDVFNVGLSHGNPGVLAFLARVAHALRSRGDASTADRAAALAIGSAGWILARRLPPDSPSTFPDHVGPDGPMAPARTAWCYGDPGVATALVAAGRVLGRDAWIAAGLDAAHRAARRPPEDTGIVDGGLCHGAAGVGHVFHRLHRATGDRTCAEAARTWFGRCLDERDRTRPHVAGLRTFSFERVREGEWAADPAWLTGAAGQGLALLAAATEREPTWDRALLLS